MSSFVIGANLPWVRYGGDFGANAWSPAGGLSTRNPDSTLRPHLEELRGLGVTHLRWFVLCDARAGVQFDSEERPLGLDDAFWRDLDAALAVVNDAGMKLLPVLFDFYLCRPKRLVNGVQLGGRRRLLATSPGRAQLLDTVVAPILRRYGREPVVAAWDLINEPEWVTFGTGTWNPFASVSRGAMRRYVRDAAALTHAETRHAVTVGSASATTLPLVEGLGLDFYQPHWYDRFEQDAPLDRPSTSISGILPVVLGEFPTRRSGKTASDVLETVARQGYDGAYFWSVLSDDEFSDFVTARRELGVWASRIAPGAGERA